MKDQTSNNNEVVVSGNKPASNADGLDLLRRFIRARSPAIERCDLCGAELGPEHPHLIEPGMRKIVCACQACAILFSSGAETKYRRIPQTVRYLPNFELTQSQWEGLMIPISMAFFFKNSVTDRMTVIYPSPAGPTESLLDFESWDEIVNCNPVLKELEPDTEALLVNRVRDSADYFIVPIDECYRLVGLIRTKWKGLAGGTEVWTAINEFFGELRKRSTRVGKTAHA